MQPRETAALVDMLNCAERIRQWVANMSKDEFIKDQKTQWAVLYDIIIIGEAVKRLSETFTNAYPGIPWRRIAAMRNILIHSYDRVDLNEVWDVVQIHLPELVRNINALNLIPGTSP